MNRKIKFRVWNKTDKEMYFSSPLEFRNLGYMDLEDGGDGLYGLMGHALTTSKGIDKNKKEFIIQQFTGLKDSKGNEIYEGDVVKFYPWNSPEKYATLMQYLCNNLKQIKYGLDVGQYSSIGFVAVNLQPADLEDGHQLNIMDSRNMEVVGNIFESSELLKDEN